MKKNKFVLGGGEQKETRPVKYRKGVILPKAKLFNWVKWLLQEKYKGKPTENFIRDIKRLEDGEPLDYVIGFTEFGAPGVPFGSSCKIDLSKKPLIPRPETEYWVEKAIEEIRKMKNPSSRDSSGQDLKILDIFAGSGCIGIAVLSRLLRDPAVAGKNAEVTFVEKDKKAIEQIKINCKLNGIDKKRYKIICSDVFKNVSGKYNYIFANPPYIADYRKNPSARLRAILRNRIQKSVLEFEPKMALFGGSDGFFYIRKFLRDARNHLNSGGAIFMEFDCLQKREIEKLIKKYNYKNYEFRKDQYNRWRWLRIE